MPGNFDARTLFSAEQFEVVHLTLQPYQHIDLHAMPFQVVFFVRSGEGTLAFQEGGVEATSGDCLQVNPGILRGWRNTGKSPLEIVVMKLLK